MTLPVSLLKETNQQFPTTKLSGALVRIKTCMSHATVLWDKDFATENVELPWQTFLILTATM